MLPKNIFIVSAARTPIGSFLGTLSEVPAVQLGSTAIREALSRAKIDANSVDETFMGMVLTGGVGQAPARQAAKGASIPDAAPATTIGKVCGSGLQSIIMATKSIGMGDARIVVAGGMESMSQTPYALPKGRSGYRMGHGQVLDTMIHDGLWDPYKNLHMGTAGELCAKELGFDRSAQDAFAKESYERAQAAQREGAFSKEIVGVIVSTKKGETLIDTDEEPKNANFEKMVTLKPAFDKSGTITAANASKINDGAAACVLADEETVKAQGLKPLARIVAYAGFAQAPEWFTTAPVGAIEAVLRRANLSVADIDLFEINEAFAVVPMACIAKNRIPREKINVRGGAIALGHPIGASGARVMVTLTHAMHDQKKRLGLATLCIGGGEALAMVIEAVSN